MDIELVSKEIKNNLKSIKDKENLKRIYSVLTPLREKMDKYDSFLTNIKDSVCRFSASFFNRTKKKIYYELLDIVEGYEFYSEEDKKYTLEQLTEAAKIHDRTFLEKIISVLRGS